MIDFNKKIKNSDKFRQPALNFISTGSYCQYPKGTTEYYNFWDQEVEKCIYGYTAEDGDYITGYNYFYLNYCPIQRLIYTTVNGETKKIRQAAFPDFYDYDYYFFQAVEEAENQGKHMVLTKARRKGYSYKTASMLCRNFFLIPNSKSYVYASNKQYLTEDGNLTKAWDYMDFIDANTAWGKKRQVANTAMRKRASMLVTDEFGNKVEMGYKSEIMGVSVKDNPNAVRGKAAKLIVWEEGGSFKELKAAWEIARPSVEQDGVAFGLMLLFGTGGDEGDNVAGLREAFYDPEAFNCIDFDNIWDEGAVGGKKCGFFVPQHTNLDVRDSNGNRLYMDEDGNTLHDKARTYILNLRAKELKSAKDSQQVDRYTAEHAETPAEAFTELSGNIFPKRELQKQLARIRTNRKLQNHKQVGELVWEQGVPKWVIKKTGDITEYPLPKMADPTGSIVIWEHPCPDPPIGLYIAGLDPYDQDQSGTNSLGSIFIYKRIQNFESYSDILVAEYTGRPKTAEEFYDNVRKLLMYYNARAMVENQNTGIFAYFNNKHCDYLLADQPDIIKDIVRDSKVNRRKGCHMNKEIKLWGEGKIKEWLEEETEPGHMRLESILSEPLLQELIMYNNKGNFDRCILKDTQITTINGFKSIQDITVDDVVLTSNGNYNKVTWIDKHVHNGRAVGLKLLGDYRILYCTDNHPIYIASTDKVKHKYRIDSLKYKHFERADKLNYKYQFGLVPKRKNLLVCDLNDDLLYLIGWFLSDGWVSLKDDKMSITLQKDQEQIVNKLINIINNYIGDEVFIKGNNRKFHSSVKKVEYNSYWRIRINSPKLHQLVTEWGCISHKKCIPTIKYLQSGLMPLVIGFLEGDGHQKLNVNYDSYNRNDIECSSIYHYLLHQIRQILIDNDVWTTIEQTKNNQLRIHIQGRYINKLLTYYNSLKFSKIVSEHIKNNVYLDEDGFWVPIKKLYEYDIKEDVYNFEVDNNHTYIANGIVTHNCMALMQVMIYREQLYTAQVKQKQEIEKKQRLFDTPIFTDKWFEQDTSDSTNKLFDSNILTFSF